MDKTKLCCAVALGMAIVVGCAKSGGGAADGEKHEKISATALPQAVRSGFDKAYPGVTIREVEKETYPDGLVHYEIKFAGSEGKEQEVELDAEGEVLDAH